jgi:hypothetical protein
MALVGPDRHTLQIRNLKEEDPRMASAAEDASSEDVEQSRPLVEPSREDPVEEWVILGFCLLAAGLFIQVILPWFLNGVAVLFAIVYYPVGIAVWLLIQQRLDQQHDIRRFRIVRLLDRDVFSIPWLLFVGLFAILDFNHAPKWLGIKEGEGFTWLCFIAVVLTFCCAVSMSIIWIASRKTYCTFKQWRLLQRSTGGRDQGNQQTWLLIRGVVVVGLCTAVWYQSLLHLDSSPVAVFIIPMVDFAMAGGAFFFFFGGGIASSRWARQQDWTQNLADLSPLDGGTNPLPQGDPTTQATSPEQRDTTE